MNKTTTFLSLAAVAVLACAVLTTTLTNASETSSVASATQSQPTMQQGFGRHTRGGIRGNPVKREVVQAAITANDFTAFQTAIAAAANGPLAGIDTVEKFTKLVKMHSLLDEARTIGDELGLKGHDGEGKGRKGGRGKGGWMNHSKGDDMGDRGGEVDEDGNN